MKFGRACTHIRGAIQSIAAEEAALLVAELQQRASELPEELAGYRYERITLPSAPVVVKEKRKMKLKKAPAASSAKASSSSSATSKAAAPTTATTPPKKPTKKPSIDGSDAQPRVLVERKELQSLQAERRTLFMRIDEKEAEVRNARNEVVEKEEALAQARVAAAQQHEVWNRHDALRCEERDTARIQAQAAEERAKVAGEARAHAEAERTRLREQLAVSEAESRRAQLEATRAVQQMDAARAQVRDAEAGHHEALHALRDELSRERERAAAAVARARELEPERETALREVAALSERLSGALSEARALRETQQQAESMRAMLTSERDAARERAEAADARAEKFNRARAAAQDEAKTLATRVATLEAAAAAQDEAMRGAAVRAQSEKESLQAHIEYAEERCREAELRQETLAKQLEAERTEMIRLKGHLQRTEERVMEEQVRAAVAEERWQPLLRQRDEAQRERARSARALSAVQAEKRELEWMVSDFRRRPASGVSAPMPAWPDRVAATEMGYTPTSAAALDASARTAAAAAGLATTPHTSTTRFTSFDSSPFGRGATHRASAAGPGHDVDGAADEAPTTTAARTYSELVDDMVDRMVNARRAEASVGGEDVADCEHVLDYDAVDQNPRPARASSHARNAPWDTLAGAYADLDQRLEAERAVANAQDPRSTPWQWAMV